MPDSGFPAMQPDPEPRPAPKRIVTVRQATEEEIEWIVGQEFPEESKLYDHEYKR